MSEDFIALGIMFILGFVFHFFHKSCELDYIKYKEDFEVFLKEKTQNSEWDYNIKKYKMDMSFARKWSAFVFKYLCFIISILGFIFFFY